MRDREYLIQMGLKIKTVRNERKISLRKLGKLCNLDYSAICRIEGGQYSAQILTLKRIADQLEVDVKEFL